MGKIIFLVVLLLGMPYKTTIAMSDDESVYRGKLVHFFRDISSIRDKEINLSASCDEVCKDHLGLLARVLNSGIVMSYWPYQYLIAPVEHATLVPLMSGRNLTTALPLSDGNIALAVGNVIKILDVDSGLILQALKRRGEGISCLASLGNEVLASASFDGKINVWNLLTGKSIQSIDGHKDYVSVLISLNDRFLVSGSGDGAIKIWNPWTGDCLQRIDFVTPIRALNYYSEDYFIVALDEDFSLRFCDRVYQRIFKGHEDFICGLLHAHNKMVVSASCDGIIKFWDFASRSCLKSTQNEEKSICSMIALSCGDFVTISKQGIVEVRSARTGQSIRRYDYCGDGFLIAQQRNGDLCIVGKEGVRLLSLYPRDVRNFFDAKIVQEYDFDVMLSLSQRAPYDYSIFYVALLMQLEHHRRRHEMIELHPEWAELFQGLPSCYQSMYEASVVIKKKVAAQQRKCVLM